MKSKKMRMIIVIVGAALLLLAIILRLSGKRAADVDLPDVAPGYEESRQQEGFSPVGTWYSDREQGDVLHLKEDGDFTSDWLAGGTYEVQEHRLCLTTSLGREVTLEIDSVVPCLRYTGKGSEHTYFTTAKLAEESRQQINAALQAEYDSDLETMMDILTAGAWHYTEAVLLRDAVPPTHEMEVTRNTIHAFIGEDEEALYDYEVKDVNISGGTITAKVGCRKQDAETGGMVWETYFYVTLEEDGNYKLSIHEGELKGYWLKAMDEPAGTDS